MRIKHKEKTAYAYIRVGHEYALDKGMSIEGQKRLIKKYCQENKIRLVNVFIDIRKSARDLNRPGLIDMLGQTVINPVNYILVTDLDRLSRNRTDIFDLDSRLVKIGVEIKTINNQPTISQATQTSKRIKINIVKGK